MVQGFRLGWQCRGFGSSCWLATLPLASHALTLVSLRGILGGC